MITLMARIGLNNSGIINNSIISPSGINISGNVQVHKGKITPTPAFILEESALDSGLPYADTLNYFRGYPCDENGKFENNYTLTVSGENISALVILFDVGKKGFPQKAVIDGKREFVDDDVQWEIIFEEKNSSHTIEFIDWNLPNSAFIISNIYTDLTIYVDNSNLLSLSTTIADRSDFKHPSYGIISNTGSLEFSDYNQDVIDLITQGVLESGTEVKVSLNDTLTKKSETVAIFESREWAYDNNNRVVSCSLKDDLEEWQDINIPAINYDIENPQTKTLEYFYNYLYGKTPQKYNMQSFEMLDSETKNILHSTTIVYPLIESNTLWDGWTKLCETAQLHIYKNYNGLTVCVYNRGN